MRIGDTNGNGTVNAADVSQTKSHLGQQINGTNFRSDVNADGYIDAGDVAMIKRILARAYNNGVHRSATATS